MITKIFPQLKVKVFFGYYSQNLYKPSIDNEIQTIEKYHNYGTSSLFVSANTRARFCFVLDKIMEYPI